MSDKDVEKFVRENADFGPLSESDVSAIARLIVKHAAECTAQAPQPAEHAGELAELQWYRDNAVLVLDKSNTYQPRMMPDRGSMATEIMPAPELAAATPQVTPRFPDCNVGTAHECCVARMKRLEKEQYGQIWEGTSEQTPQVTPCDHFWRTVAVNPRWSWFTECEKCKIGAPLELQAENYVEGTSEQAPYPNDPSLMCAEGRHKECTGSNQPWWVCGCACHKKASEQASPIGFVSEISYPGPSCTFCGGAMVLKCLSCGSTSELTEQASHTPDKCPTCGNTRQQGYGKIGNSECRHTWHLPECEDHFHSSAATQKEK